MVDDIVTFLRRRDYKYIRELGSGACGKTVLLLDDTLNLHFVCKKFAPFDPKLSEELFSKFMKEIKLMHLVYHPNIVRVFNYYAFPRARTGYIIMEYVEGETIDKYIKASPKSFDATFRQTIEAFCHLEACRILHRDIRVQNILVRNDGIIKVIDLGFGTNVQNNEDFAKSITLNWPYSRPDEFFQGRYDFKTEIYFVGKLFEQIMEDTPIEESSARGIIQLMCASNPSKRISSFAAVKQRLDQCELVIPEFDSSQIQAYRYFADELTSSILKIDLKAENIADVQRILTLLESVYKSCMLEETVSADRVCPCLISGTVLTSHRVPIYVSTVRDFLSLLKHSNPGAQKIILANLFSRLNEIERFDEDEIPF